MKSLNYICGTALALSCFLGSAVPSAEAFTPDTLETLDTLGISIPWTDALTRGEFCQLLYDVTGQNALSAAASPFSDVPSWREDAQAVTAIYQMGLLNGNGDGTFAPDRQITLGEAVTAVLRMLEYSPADIGYRWPEDYIQKAEDLGLLAGIGTDASGTLNQEMTSQFFFQILSHSNPDGSTFGENLGASVVRNVVLLSNYAENGGVSNQLSVLSNGAVVYYEKTTDMPQAFLGSCRGTLLLDETGLAMGFLPNEEHSVTVDIQTVDALSMTDRDGTVYAVPSATTMMLGETKSTFGESYFSANTYTNALLCYGSSGTVELVVLRNNTEYADFVVTAFYEQASPNPYQPETITVMGWDFAVNADIAWKFAQYAYGEQFHLVLDEDGSVKDVLAYQDDLNETMVGFLGKDDVVTLLNGLEFTGSNTNPLAATEGQLVRISARGLGEVSIAPIRTGSSRHLDLDAMTLGEYKLSEDVRFYECVEEGAAVAMDIDKIVIKTVDKSKVRYYHLDNDGKVDFILLNNATGDLFQYGFVETTTITSSSSFGTISNAGAYLKTPLGNSGTVQTFALQNNQGDIGGIAYASDGTYVASTILTPTASFGRAAINGTESVVCDGVRVLIWDDVAVYDTVLDRWTSLTYAMTERETFVGYYDSTIEEGGKIRVILAS